MQSVSGWSISEVLLLVYALGWLWQITMGRRPPPPPALLMAPQKQQQTGD
jgi:hypothetical protein